MASKSFFAALSGGHDIVFVRKSLVDLTGDIVTAAVLSQIAYWFDTGPDGKRRVQVFKHGRYWLAKQRDDWWEECRVSAKQFDRAANKLKEMGLIETKNMRFNGMRTLHIWFNEDRAEELYNAQGVRPKLPDGEDRNSPKGKTEIAERGRPLTETTAKPTAKETHTRAQAQAGPLLSVQEEVDTADPLKLIREVAAKVEQGKPYWLRTAKEMSIPDAEWPGLILAFASYCYERDDPKHVIAYTQSSMKAGAAFERRWLKNKKKPKVEKQREAPKMSPPRRGPMI